MKPHYPILLYATGSAQVIAVSGDQVVLLWEGAEVGRFTTPMAAVRCIHAELLTT